MRVQTAIPVAAMVLLITTTVPARESPRSSSLLSFSDCHACVEAGYGWSSKKQRCGGFANKVCPTAGAETAAQPATFGQCTPPVPAAVRRSGVTPQELARLEALVETTLANAPPSLVRQHRNFGQEQTLYPGHDVTFLHNDDAALNAVRPLLRDLALQLNEIGGWGLMDGRKAEDLSLRCIEAIDYYSSGRTDNGKHPCSPPHACPAHAYMYISRCTHIYIQPCAMCMPGTNRLGRRAGMAQRRQHSVHSCDCSFRL